jgi:hypothetical protein
MQAIYLVETENTAAWSYEVLRGISRVWLIAPSDAHAYHDVWVNGRVLRESVPLYWLVRFRKIDEEEVRHVLNIPELFGQDDYREMFFGYAWQTGLDFSIAAEELMIKLL